MRTDYTGITVKSSSRPHAAGPKKGAQPRRASPAGGSRDEISNPISQFQAQYRRET